MDVIARVKDTEISKVIDPTVAAFAPLLKSKKTFIREIPRKTFKYGSTDRHQLDVYYPIAAPKSGTTPILFFIYGGGFNTGDRLLSPATFGLVYACLAAFYARRGFIVVIPDYRLVPNVTFPGPAEDVRDAMRWAVQNTEHLVSTGSPSPDTNTLLIMGHSAGAAHAATMLFSTDVLGQDDELRSKIVAAILVSGPYDLVSMDSSWPTADIHIKYWGSLEQVKTNDPVHLFRRLPQPIVERLPKILLVEGENEPNWLLDAGKVFQESLEQRLGQPVKKIIGMGHNHISLTWALSTGQGEEWGEDVLEWYKKEVVSK
ncbi:alpha/beta hydrolase domain-containing protein [Crassisporium funariophilum]|nr:alpha/beta hydrolase domain-containing protein [Crassisporium funariophilum]